MTYEVPGHKQTVIMAADYRAGQYRATVLNGSGLGAVPGAGVRVYGVVQNKPNVGQAGTVMTSGISKMEAGAAVAAGAKVMTDASGRAITATATNFVIGTAREAAGAAGVYLPVDLDATQPVL
jgi:predicted RecA/RadA family phage recombinase